MIVKPAIASHKVTIRDQDTNADGAFLVASSAREIVMALVNGPAAFRIYDSKDIAVLDEKNSVLVSANAGECVGVTPAQLIPFNNGIVVVMEQGKGLNGELFLLLN